MRRHVFGHRSGVGHYRDVEWGDGHAEVYGVPFIFDSKIFDGKVLDFPVIIRSTVRGKWCIVSGKALLSDSDMDGEALVGDTAIVHHSKLSGSSRVIEDGRVVRCVLSDNATVAGTASVIGTAENPVILFGDVYIDRGVWHRAPLSFSCKSGYVVTESTGNLVTVSCTTNTIDRWLGGAGRRYGKVVGMSEEEIDEVQGYVENIRDFKIAALKAGEHWNV